MRKMRKYRDYLIEKLSDHEEAIAYLQTSLEEYEKDGNTSALLLALRSIAEAQGGRVEQLLKDIEADILWDESLAKSPDVLAALAEKAREEYRAGRTKELTNL